MIRTADGKGFGLGIPTLHTHLSLHFTDSFVDCVVLCFSNAVALFDVACFALSSGCVSRIVQYNVTLLCYSFRTKFLNRN